MRKAYAPNWPEDSPVHAKNQVCNGNSCISPLLCSYLRPHHEQFQQAHEHAAVVIEHRKSEASLKKKEDECKKERKKALYDDKQGNLLLVILIHD